MKRRKERRKEINSLFLPPRTQYNQPRKTLSDRSNENAPKFPSVYRSTLFYNKIFFSQVFPGPFGIIITPYLCSDIISGSFRRQGRLGFYTLIEVCTHLDNQFSVKYLSSLLENKIQKQASKAVLYSPETEIKP